MKLKICLSFSIACCILLASCVPTKKYQDLERQALESKKENSKLQANLDKNRHLQYDVTRLEKEQRKNKANYEELETRFAALSQSHQNLQFSYDQLLTQSKEVLSTTSLEKQTLTDSLARQIRLLDIKERELKRLEESMMAEKANLDQIRLQLQQQEQQLSQVDGQFSDYEKQVQELQAALQAKELKLLEMRRSINKALLGFTDSDLTVSEKNGKIYVSLSQDLLFASGSDNINWKGKKAVMQVAQALQENPDILVNVEGHTDSDGSASSNWDLSVRRATAVVKVLIGQGVDARRVTASGRAFYDPIAPNDSAVNKAKNRRTEIILTPKLGELYEIVNDN